jgi:hypothetical protein
MKTLTMHDIQKRAKPIAEKYGVTLWLFGSYARGTQKEASDIDFCVDTAGSKIKTLFEFGPFFTELANEFSEIYFDLITLGSLYTPNNRRFYPDFLKEFNEQKVLLYGKQ